MTRKIAKREIDSLDYYLQNHTNDYSEESHMAMMMAIDALEQESCEDCISRHAVLETIDNRIEQIKKDANEINKSYSHLSFAEGIHDGYCRLKCDLRILSSVTPQLKTGQWWERNTYPLESRSWDCSECQEIVFEKTNYCPSCGAKMEVKA